MATKLNKQLILSDPGWCARITEESAKVSAENARLSRILRRLAEQRAIDDARHERG